LIPLRDENPSRRPPYVVWGLIVANALVFLLELSLPPDSLQVFFHLFGIVPARFTHPEWAQALGFPADNWWPFLTSLFIHGGWFHILGNMWFLWIFGDNVEDRMGHGRFLVFYLLCGVLAGMAHMLTNPSSTIPAFGASGAISGVLGAYLLFFPRARVLVLFPIFIWPLFFVLPASLFLGIWFVIQFFSGTFSLLSPKMGGGVAWWAHIGGFISGLSLAPLFLPGRKLR